MQTIFFRLLRHDDTSGKAGRAPFRFQEISMMSQ